MARFWAAWAILAGMALASSAIAAPPVETTPTQPYATQFDITSTISGRRYRIFVHKPDAAPPAAGYPAVTFTDANIAFPIATMAGLLAEASGPSPLIIGVGYPLDDIKTLTIMRNRDLTPTQPPGTIQQYPGYTTMTPADFAGSELFYRFLTEELRPALAKRYPLDLSRQTLAGHSLGGMFVLTVLLRHPAAYRSYVAASPSIWWNNRSILEEVPGFLRQVSSASVAPRLLITAGGREDDIPDQLPPGMDRAKLVENFKTNGILVNARALAGQLQVAKGGPGYSAQLTVFADEDHNSVIPSYIGRAVRFAAQE